MCQSCTHVRQRFLGAAGPRRDAIAWCPLATTWQLPATPWQHCLYCRGRLQDDRNNDGQLIWQHSHYCRGRLQDNTMIVVSTYGNIASTAGDACKTTPWLWWVHLTALPLLQGTPARQHNNCGEYISQHCLYCRGRLLDNTITVVSTYHNIASTAGDACKTTRLL